MTLALLVRAFFRPSTSNHHLDRQEKTPNHCWIGAILSHLLNLDPKKSTRFQRGLLIQAAFSWAGPCQAARCCSSLALFSVSAVGRWYSSWANRAACNSSSLAQAPLSTPITCSNCSALKFRPDQLSSE